jgi:glycosyltransferase involved in cell wall biosynthesis
MELAVQIAGYVAAAIMVSVSGAWIWLIRAMILSLRTAPHLDEPHNASGDTPKVSIILPARNEEEYIGKCLDSLLAQDYPNYEIVAVDDESQDGTGGIISEYAGRDERVIHVTAGPKPPDWVAKTWPCHEGYGRASGDLLLFTDADAEYAHNTISLAVSHLLSEKLDALTASPRLLCPDFWTKIILPVIVPFVHTRFSALKVNDPISKVGYFFGSFFIITRRVYDAVGTHEAVKNEIVEDAALGNRTKAAGHRIKMVRGERFVSAVWARNASNFWSAMKRLVVPLYLQSKSLAIGSAVSVIFLFLAPFPLLAYSALSGMHDILCWASLSALLLIYTACSIESHHLKIGAGHAALIPLGIVLVVSAFLSGLIHARSSDSVSWRGRSYTLKDHIKSG